MPSSTPEPREQAAEQAALLAGRLLGRAPDAVEQIRVGRNNQVWRIDAAPARFALKLHAAVAGDGRDRFAAEHGAYRFLAGHGCRFVPALIAADPDARAVLTEWIDGAPITAPTGADIDDALAFTAELFRLRHAGAGLPAASEACPTGAALIGQIEARLQRFRTVEAVADLVAAAAADLARLAADPDRAAAEAPEPTLSPSDFGFHNAGRPPAGRTRFFDLEYFGRDDPVKLAADFLLHPGMALDSGSRARVLRGLGEVFRSDPGFTPRLAALLPLYALRWVLILLNEFAADPWARRRHAGWAGRDAVLSRQLEKAYAMRSTLLALERDGIDAL